MAEGGTKKMSCGYIINGRMNNNRRQLLESKTKESCQLAGQGNLQRRAPEQNLQPPEAFLWPHTKNMNILYTGNNITTLISVKIDSSLHIKHVERYIGLCLPTKII